MKLTEKQLRKLVNEELSSFKSERKRQAEQQSQNEVAVLPDVADHVRTILMNIAAHVERLNKAETIHLSDIENCIDYLEKRVDSLRVVHA